MGSKVLAGHDLNIPLEPFFADLNGPGNGIAQEQAWIWGMENPMQFFGQG